MLLYIFILNVILNVFRAAQQNSLPFRNSVQARRLHGSESTPYVHQLCPIRSALNNSTDSMAAPIVSHGPGIPMWSGAPAEFDEFANACYWYRASMKPNERLSVVAPIWGNLSGPPKRLVKSLNPDKFEVEDGPEQFLKILMQSPLGQVPVVDSFSKIASTTPSDASH